MYNILIVEDEAKMAEVISAYLNKEGYKCDIANNGKVAIDYFEKSQYDLVILDRMLPGISGEEVCKQIRKTSMVHIIMLTARTDDEDKIEGFNLGCDDYVCKPFNVKELVLRVKAVTKRLIKEDSKILKFGDQLEIDTLAHQIKVRNEDIIVTNTEYKILLSLALNPNKLFTREELLEVVLDEYTEKIDRVIDAHVKNLRRKIEEDTKKPRIIVTVYGVGYKFGLQPQKDNSK